MREKQFNTMSILINHNTESCILDVLQTAFCFFLFQVTGLAQEVHREWVLIFCYGYLPNTLYAA